MNIFRSKHILFKCCLCLRVGVETRKGVFLSLTNSEHLEKRNDLICNPCFDPLYYLVKFKAHKYSRYTCLTEFLLFIGGKAVPLFTSQTSPAKMSVTLPSVNLEDCSQSLSISTIQGDTESSGADTF